LRLGVCYFALQILQALDKIYRQNNSTKPLLPAGRLISRNLIQRRMKPKKLIRKFITEKLKEGEWETITDQDELNRLYAIKVREELAEIQASDHKDIMEFVDLIQVAFSFAKQNGFTHEQLSVALIEKSVEKGSFGRLALNNLNPDNPSNKLYFENVT
jgi:predicted house-cleaning noncanonical NTP pyrophosphatase (MazG superfamily)